MSLEKLKALGDFFLERFANVEVDYLVTFDSLPLLLITKRNHFFVVYF
jgi:hypothetical protein